MYLLALKLMQLYNELIIVYFKKYAHKGDTKYVALVDHIYVNAQLSSTTLNISEYNKRNVSIVSGGILI